MSLFYVLLLSWNLCPDVVLVHNNNIIFKGGDNCSRHDFSKQNEKKSSKSQVTHDTFYCIWVHLDNNSKHEMVMQYRLINNCRFILIKILSLFHVIERGWFKSEIQKRRSLYFVSWKLIKYNSHRLILINYSKQFPLIHLNSWQKSLPTKTSI